MLHYAGTQNASNFYSKVQNVDYDIIGISFYLVWHYQTIDILNAKLVNLADAFNKKIMVAETAYPFTLQWNDFTNNIVGLPSQLIAPCEATPNGQRDFIQAFSNMKNTNAKYKGFCYWGASWVAFKGPTAADASSWEN